MRDQLLKGHLDFLILASLDGKPAHGYAVIQELRQRSGGAFSLPEGTIYPALHRLERAGLLSDRWSTHMGRRRCIYRLTAKGRRALSEHRRDWPKFSGAVAAVLEPIT